MIPRISLSVTPKHDAVICSLATGDYAPMMNLMEKTVRYYSKRHGFDHLLLRDTRFDPSRPVSWDRVILLRHLLKFYSLVIWLDADVMIVDPRKDIRTALNPNHSVYVVKERIPENGNEVPNTGVWILRSRPEALDLLEAVWDRTDCINDGWHEQKAFLFLIGWVTGKFKGPTPYSGMVEFIDKQWNSLPRDPSPHPRIIHYTVPDRLRYMAQAYERFCKDFPDAAR